MNSLKLTVRGVVFGLFCLAAILAAPQAKADTVDVNIQGFAFAPQNVKIGLGTTVRWTNNDSAPHTSTSDGAVWDSGNLNNGESFSYTFNALGDFPYHCEIHPGMLGNVKVVDPSLAVPGLTVYGAGALVLLLSAAAWWFFRRRQTATVAQ